MAEPVPDMGKKIRSGTKWSFASSLSTEVLNFAVGIVLARLLLPADFGLIATVGVLTGLAGYFAGAGTGQALVRAEEAGPRHFNIVFTLQLIIGSLIYLGFVIAAPAFSRFFEQPIYHTLLLISGLSFFIRPFINIPTSWLQREMHFRPIFISNAITLLAGSGVSVGMALAGYGVWSLIAGGLFGSLLRAVILNFYVRHAYALAWDKAVIHDMGGYGAKVAANSLIEHFRSQSLILILSKLSGPTDVGLYNRAASLSIMPMRIVGTSPYQAVFRALAAEQDNLDKSRYIYYRTITLVTTYTLPLFVLAWWLAEPGIRFLYGDKWLASAAPLALLATTGLFQCIGNPSGAVIEARNRMTAEVKLNIVAWLILVAGVIHGLQWGLIGVAWAVVAMTVFFNMGLVIVAAREIQGTLRALFKALQPALLLNGMLIATLWLAHALALAPYAQSNPGLYSLLMTSLGGAVYALAFLYLPIESLKTESAKWRRTLRLNT